MRSTSTTHSPISTSPVGRLALTVPSGRCAHDAGDPHDVLAAHVDVVVDDALDDAGVVAHVDEREVLAVLAAAGDPAADADGLADVARAQLAAQVGAHRGRSRTGFIECRGLLPGG